MATALMDGVVTGYVSPAGAVFDADAVITCSEASVLLDALRWDEAAPAWAAQSTADLSACGILPDGRGYDEPLTRADAADMLVSAMEVLEKR